MPVCCRCNGSGRCVSCSCVKAGRSCTDCLPSRNGRCSNAPSPNRQATLLNCRAICPALSYILINTYRNNSQLFVDGQCILSKEGTTQGDPLAMAMYATGTQPLIHRLDGIAKQVWYADDSAAGSSIENLKRWWDLLVEIGPQIRMATSEITISLQLWTALQC